MKIDKQKEKEISKVVKAASRKRGYKFKQDCIFFVKKECFIECLFSLKPSNEIDYMN